MSKHSKIIVTHSSRGIPQYEIEIQHEELSKFEVVKGDSEAEVWEKAAARMERWDREWAGRQHALERKAEKYRKMRAARRGRELARKRTEEARQTLISLTNLLQQALEKEHGIRWDALKDHSDYSRPRPTRPPYPADVTRPVVPAEPQPGDERFSSRTDPLDWIIGSRKERKQKASHEQFEQAHREWQQEQQAAEEEYEAQRKKRQAQVRQIDEAYRIAVARWEDQRARYLNERDARNAAVEEKRAAFERRDPRAVLEVFERVLTESDYPETFPQAFSLDYNPGRRILVVDYEVPAIGDMPTVKQVRYRADGDRFEKRHISNALVKKLYNTVLYQIALRTLHELFAADTGGVLHSVVFNGYLPTGRSKTNGDRTFILSVKAGREEWQRLNLGELNPRVVFKRLKGVAGARPYTGEPVKPLLQVD